MFEIFYNFCGWNQKLFLILNYYSNFGIAPVLSRVFAEIFDIFHVGLFILMLSVYFYIKLQFVSDQTIRLKQFWSIYYSMAKIWIVYGVFGLVYAVLKFTFNLPRPFCSLSLNNFITIIDTTSIRCLSSFPSAHTGLSLICVYCVWSRLNRLQKIISVFMVTLIALSRITLAMHYPADIIYSIPIAVAVIFLSKAIYGLLYKTIEICGRFLYNNFMFTKF